MNFKHILNSIDTNDFSKVRAHKRNNIIMFYDHRCEKYMKIDNEPFGQAQVQYSGNYGAMSIVHFDRENMQSEMIIALRQNDSFRIKLNSDIEANLFQLSTLREISEKDHLKIMKTYWINEMIKNTESIDKIRICIFDFSAFFIEKED